MFDAQGRCRGTSRNPTGEDVSLRFAPEHFGTFSAIKTSALANPNSVLLIACSDHFEGPQNISGIPFERLLVIQTLAASVAHRTDGLANQGLSLLMHEYEIRHVVVCGHLGCGVIRHWLREQMERRQTSQHCEVENRPWSPKTASLDHTLVRAAVESYTVMQLANLQSHLTVWRRLISGELKIHGWIADDRTASVRFFNPGRRRFETQQFES